MLKYLFSAHFCDNVPKDKTRSIFCGPSGAAVTATVVYDQRRVVGPVLLVVLRDGIGLHEAVRKGIHIRVLRIYRRRPELCSSMAMQPLGKRHCTCYHRSSQLQLQSRHLQSVADYRDISMFHIMQDNLKWLLRSFSFQVHCQLSSWKAVSSCPAPVQ